MNDEFKLCIQEPGTITIHPDESILVTNFIFGRITYQTAQEVAIRYAIDILQRELMRLTSHNHKTD